MSRSARILALACALAVATAMTATEASAGPISGPGSKRAQTDSVSTVSAKRDSAASAPTKLDSASSLTAMGSDTVAKPKIDSMDLKQLPPRALPLKEQMMFAGGFMICVAIMLTSMQNFNPND